MLSVPRILADAIPLWLPLRANDGAWSGTELLEFVEEWERALDTSPEYILLLPCFSAPARRDLRLVWPEAVPLLLWVGSLWRVVLLTAPLAGPLPVLRALPVLRVLPVLRTLLREVEEVSLAYPGRSLLRLPALRLLRVLRPLRSDLALPVLEYPSS